MQTRTVGILAHVDAGKTTLSEQILYQAHTIRQAGRVDNRDSFLDTDPLEKQRGITIFSGQAPFFWEDCPWYLLDTPGHADFSPEMERCIPVMDAAVVVISATEGIQGHTETIWRLLRRFQIPTFFFLNKIDLPGARPQEVREQIQQRFHTVPALVENGITPEMTDVAAEEDDAILERYLAGDIQEEEWPKLLLPALRCGKLCPCVEGAALQYTIGYSSFAGVATGRGRKAVFCPCVSDTSRHTGEPAGFFEGDRRAPLGKRFSWGRKST